MAPAPIPRRRRSALLAAILTAAVVVAAAGVVALVAQVTGGGGEPAPPAASQAATAAPGTGPGGTGPSGSGPSGNGPSGSGPSGSGPSGTGPDGTGPSGTGSPDDGVVGEPTPAAVGLVDTSAVAADPLAPAVAGMFDRYFTAINARDYDLAVTHYDPAGVIDPGDPQERQAFAAGVSTTTDSQIRLLSIAPGGDGGTVLARIAFRSQQDPGYGPKGRERETCTRWDVTYALSTAADGRYLILRATVAASQPCR
ncbi:hypothetical protein Psuf_088250 [Phytohabitans suffuscus]|uniref:SnoaL-like domain-containing protein n=1 Tax=Phytohabitans suffuscus TaxID=624315 RepID=A0A6F8YZJ6_9ACTN|nr:hypothetical protein [Phytohabitans suffuscus]BCB91512.1 hypothetical protein Psuf_088250 [Phytohabitans suffuscus]